MKRFISMLLVLSILAMMFSCANSKEIDGITYDTYGLINKENKRNPDIQYEVVWGNVIWSVILSETIVVPVYMIGFSIMEPVGKIDPNAIKGKL